MEYRELGKSGMRISTIGFGCMSLSARQEKESTHLLQRAVDGGINYFDTADLYEKGANEILVGKALRDVRGKVFIATKVGNQWRSDGSGWDWNPRKEYILASVERSLQRLQTDYIDLYQLHGGTLEDPVDETIEAFELLREQGKIRHYGISSIRPNVIDTWLKRSSLASVMLQYSLADRRPEEELLQWLLENKVGVLVRGAVAQGMLVNKPAKDYNGYRAEEITLLQQAIHSVSTPARTPAQSAIDYVRQHSAISSVVLGIRTNAQLEEALMGYPPLNPQEWKMLKDRLKANRYEQHRVDH